PLLQAGFHAAISRPAPGRGPPCLTAIPICSRKAGYAVHSAPASLRTALQVLIPLRTDVASTTGEYAPAQEQVSAAAGSGSPCHWRPPVRRRRNTLRLPSALTPDWA